MVLANPGYNNKEEQNERFCLAIRWHTEVILASFMETEV
jgi:hypothetical protein